MQEQVQTTVQQGENSQVKLKSQTILRSPGPTDSELGRSNPLMDAYERSF